MLFIACGSWCCYGSEETNGGDAREEHRPAYSFTVVSYPSVKLMGR
jgi:hypothetical protein